jgi:hypothetical protein
MKKKIAVLVRDRQGEALRMAVGLTLEDDEVNVFVMDSRLADEEAVTVNLETLKDLDIKMYSNVPENGLEAMSTEDMARALVNYDSVIPY